MRKDKPRQAEPSFALISSFMIHPSTLPGSALPLASSIR
jgi:hypothetical protein